MMKRIFPIIFCSLLIIALAGCASRGARPASRADKASGAQILPSYPGPKAKIAIADFEVKAAKASSKIGSELRERLITALINSNRFSVVEQIKDADLIITAALTEFEPKASGGRAGVGGGGGVGNGILGGLLGKSPNKAHMALDIRIVDEATSEVLASTRAVGQTSDMSGSNGVTPIEKATSACIIEALRFIAQATPANYYKY